MTWTEAAVGPFERLLEAEAEVGAEAVRRRLEGLRLAYLELRAGGTDRPLAEGLEAARTKGPWVLWMLRGALSPPVFQPVREAWKRGEALETAELRELAEREGGADLEAFFDFWVYRAEAPEYHLHRAEAKGEGGGFAVTLQVENRGTGVYPVPVVVQTEEGARHTFPVKVAPRVRADVRLAVVTKPVMAAVDPEREILMACGERPWLPVRLRRFGLF